MASHRPHPAWMFLGFVIVIATVRVISEGLLASESTAENVGSAVGLLLCLAGAAWALERGLRGTMASAKNERSMWIFLAATMTIATVASAIAMLSAAGPS